MEWRWVEGHLDKIGKILDWCAFQNQKIDLDAKALLQRCKQTTSLTATQKGVKQAKIDRNFLYAALFPPHILSYWGNHHDIKFDPQSTFD